jgi:hypothetical protein
VKLLKIIIKDIFEFLINVSVGAIVFMLNILALHLYLHREDYLLGNWTIPTVFIIPVLTMFLIGRGVKEE